MLCKNSKIFPTRPYEILSLDLLIKLKSLIVFFKTYLGISAMADLNISAMARHYQKST